MRISAQQNENRDRTKITPRLGTMDPIPAYNRDILAAWGFDRPMQTLVSLQRACDVQRDPDGEITQATIHGQPVYPESLPVFSHQLLTDRARWMTREIFSSTAHFWEATDLPFAKRMQAFFDQAEDTFPPEPHWALGGTARVMVAIGLGIGIPVRQIYEALPCQHLVILETAPEAVALTASNEDLREWEKWSQGRHGSISVLVHSDPAALAEQAIQLLEKHHGAVYDGSCLVQSSPLIWTQGVRERIMASTSRITANPGFFDDEIKNLSQALTNLKRNPGRFLYPQPTMSPHPVAIVGSGPSLSASLPKLREIQDRAIIISCGSAYGALRTAGIRPGFQVETENILELKDFYAWYEQTFGNDLPIGLLSFSVDPKLALKFQRRLYFCRDNPLLAKVLEPECPPFQGSWPTVSQSAFSIAVHCGFSPIYFFGIDLGSQNPTQFHARSTAYEHTSFSETAGITKMDRTVTGNFGRPVFTYDNLLAGRSVFTNLIKKTGHDEVWNCSDGVAIEGCRPLRPDRLRIDATPGQKRQAMVGFLKGAKVTSELSLPSLSRNNETFKNVERACFAWKDKTLRFLERAEHARNARVIYDDYINTFSRVGTETSECIAASFWRGSAYIFVGMAHVHLRRRRPSFRYAFHKAIFRFAQAEVHDMGQALEKRLAVWRHLIS